MLSDARELEGLTVVGPAQVLLDLAGMGYAVWDVTREMMEHYVSSAGR